MNTPLTDESSFSTVYQGELVKASFARRLELDRAALMEALGQILKYSTPSASDKIKARSALAAARVNFPQP